MSNHNIKLVAISAHPDCVQTADISEELSVIEAKGHARQILEEKPTGDRLDFHPTQDKHHKDVLNSVQNNTQRLAPLKDDEVCSGCPDEDSYLLADVPSWTAPTPQSGGLNNPQSSLLDPMQPFPKLSKHARKRRNRREKELMKKVKSPDTAETNIVNSGSVTNTLNTGPLPSDLDTATMNVDGAVSPLSAGTGLSLESLLQRIEGLQAESEAQQKRIEGLQAESEAQQKRINQLEQNVDAHTGWIVHKDTAMLNKIKLRDLLDRAQAALALSMLAGPDHPMGKRQASLMFREALGPTDDHRQRIKTLVKMIEVRRAKLPRPIVDFLSKADVIALLAHPSPTIPTDRDADAIAHHGGHKNTRYESAVDQRSNGPDKSALQALLDLLSELSILSTSR